MVNLDLQQKMELILTVGQILAENGATADTILTNTKRVAAMMKIPAENFTLKVLPTVLSLNIYDGRTTNLAFRNYGSRGIDATIVNLIDSFTLKAASQNYTPQNFQDVLDRIASKKRIYSHGQVVVATGLFCGAFCFMFGGDCLASVYTMVCASIGKVVQIYSLKHGINHFFAIAVAAFVATLSAYFAHFLPTETMWLPLIACSLFLIPGIPIINAIKESLGGFLLTGMIKAYNSFLIALSMVLGMVFAAEVCLKLDGLNNIDLTNLTLAAEHNFVELLFAGTIISVSFATFINAPKKILPLLGGFGVTALVIKNFVLFGLNLSQEFATFFAALVIGILATKAKDYVQMPTQFLTVPAIISFVPGVLIYRFLSACMYITYYTPDEFFHEIVLGIDAVQIVFAMTMGIILPSLMRKIAIWPTRKKLSQHQG